jgi:hypothetical protein
MTVVTLNLPDALAQKLNAMPDRDEYATEVFMHDLAELTEVADLTEVNDDIELSEEEEEALAASNAQACLDSLAAYERGEYVPARDFFARKKAEWEAIKKQRESKKLSAETQA